MTRNDPRNAGVCVAVVAAAIVLVWPFAEMPYADDWAYSHIALQLAQTGHFNYNGNESAILLPQAYWGAFVIRLFGFSFTAMRLCSVPFALGAVGLCYLLVRRMGLTASYGVPVTLLFGLSPLFLPVAVSFMTDALFLFSMFLCLYLLVRSAEACAPGTKAGAWWAWLALGASTGLVGGTGRQVVWLVPLVVLPYLAWVCRRWPWFSLSALGSWLVVLAGALAMTAWFNRQPYVITDPSIGKQLVLGATHPLAELNISARMPLTLLLLVLPAALPLVLSASVDTWRAAGKRQILVAACFMALLAALLIHPSLASIPWMASTLNWEGIHGTMELPGRPVVLIRPVRAVIAIGVYAAAILLASELWDVWRLARRALHFLLNPPAGQLTLAAFSLFGATYLALLILRAAYIDLFDRYLLPLIPWFAALLFLWNGTKERGQWALRCARPGAWALLMALALYAVASTQDVLALARARATATARLEAAGVPRTAIDAGYEYNGWTELLVGGHANLRWIVNPPGAYRPGLSPTPSVKPLYRLEYQPTPETVTTPFGSVPYVSLLPPFRKQVYIDRIVKP